MVSTTTFHTIYLFGVTAMLGASTLASARGAQEPRPISETRITFSDGTAQSGSAGGITNMCAPPEGDKILDPPYHFVFVVNGDKDKTKLELECHAECKKVSDKKAEMTFIDHDPWLEATNADVGRVWCDKVKSRDESIWKDVKDIRLPDSDKL
ncbi:uncharacterized protein I303_100841 [Kwoniella dejecticola CBS 10117]|uniref:Uncharacterized protein n=1 Tax=Kwoniella dejecticola CBS 10117 TaxID=1296121 RepID=A0A1A6AG57_9TREE|nr:uncharacterized protein I303_00843 [Kwoniella dejecticola CBS 10117]OBR89021.1 hypothetical protein I303_00843 [Kwoniella dejecticola CBS 10117]